MSAGPLAAEQAAVSLLRAFRPLFAEVERAADAFRATLLECDALVSKATNLASRLANASNADTGLGCLVAFPRVRERLVTKQLDQLGLVYSALKIRMYVRFTVFPSRMCSSRVHFYHGSAAECHFAHRFS